jgi:2-amino-4-hydroxy-6-hydroxymethyldihydropteridine diphosphokinase
VVERVSGVYETAPREVEDQSSFLNAACGIRTGLDPPALLALIKGIERDLGRVAGPRYGPRAIDLDILLWDGGVWSDDALEVPHPRLGERRFAMVPLLDVEPGVAMPDGTALRDLADAIGADEQPVRRSSHLLTVPRLDV